MVLAIATAEKIGSETRDGASHRRYFQLAARDIGLDLAADDVNCIQCLLLFVMYGINEPQSVNLWYTIGLALRLAVGIDMHRQEVSLGPDLLETEMRKRLWWCVYVMDRSIFWLWVARWESTIPTSRHHYQKLSVMINSALDFQFPCHHPIAPNLRDVLALIDTVKLRRLNASVYTTFHAAGRSGAEESLGLDAVRQQHYVQLSDWLANALVTSAQLPCFSHLNGFRSRTIKRSSRSIDPLMRSLLPPPTQFVSVLILPSAS